jgi:Ca2+-binding EF-hand superfamily protein
MTKNKWLLGSVLSTVAFVGVAAAQPGPSKHFEQMDSNGDGVVTSAELEKGFLERFTKSDANHDGKVTSDEFKAQHEAMKKEHEKHEGMGHGGRGHGHGHDGKGPDGKGPHGLPGDSNGDGVVTKAEAQADVQTMLKKLDTNSDGKLTKDELDKGPMGHGHCGGKGAAEQAPLPATAPATTK